MSFLLALLFVACASSLTDVEYRNSFESFKIEFHKKYTSAEEEAHRFAAFRTSLDFVMHHDPVKTGFTVKINEFADLTSAEFNSIYNRLNITVDPSRLVVDKEEAHAPQAATVDWRTKGAVTGVKNQGQCGSCWSFSATGSMEAAHFFKAGKLVSLSEQNLVDCSTAQGNAGCNGGLMDQAFQYVIANKGIDTEASYPYTATGPNTCQFSSSNIGATITSYTDVTVGSESALLTAVTGRPVSVAIDASNMSFQLYSSGVYYEPACSSTSLDHGVLAVGYGIDSGSDYWLVKNSWGTSWGMNGYIYMSRNKNNNCGIATAASFPIA